MKNKKSEISKIFKELNQAVYLIFASIIPELLSVKTKKAKQRRMEEYKKGIKETFSYFTIEDGRFDFFWYIRMQIVEKVLKKKRIKYCPQELEDYLFEEILASVHTPNHLLKMIEFIIPIMAKEGTNPITSDKILHSSVHCIGSYRLKNNKDGKLFIPLKEKKAAKNLFKLLNPYIEKAKVLPYAEETFNVSDTAGIKKYKGKKYNLLCLLQDGLHKMGNS